MNTLWKHSVPTPLGLLTLIAIDTGLTRILVPGDPATLPEARQGAKHPILEQTEQELTAWFAGTRREFDVMVDVVGSFWQRSVWNAVSTIPFGGRCSYGEIARLVGSPRTFRAVGLANAQNLLRIVVPCHRVVCSNGKLTGYTGGIEAKAWLLQHEQAVLPDEQAGLPDLARSKNF